MSFTSGIRRLLFAGALAFGALAQTSANLPLRTRALRLHAGVNSRSASLEEPTQVKSPEASQPGIRPASLITPITPTSTALAVSPNPALFGQLVTLTATVSGIVASGTATFYDGVTVLGTARVNAGQAIFTTSLLESGTRALRVRFDGNLLNATSLSAPVPANINVPPGAGLSFSGLVPTGSGPEAVAVADFNGDSIADLASANTSDGTVTISLGNGSGSFQFQGSFPVLGSGPWAVVTGDFNGDGRQDVAAANGGSGSVSILLGNGDGTLQPPMVIQVGTMGGEPYALTAADLNADGILDLAVVLLESQSVVVLLGNGDGTMRNAGGFLTGVEPSSITVGDFNGDGIPDLAVANSFPSSTQPAFIQVMLGRGDGTFIGGAQLATGLFPTGVIAGDWNNDGKTDLAVADNGDLDTQALGDVEVFLGKGDGSFQPRVLSLAGTEPWTLASGDFNGDGLLDLVVVNGVTDYSGNPATNLSLLTGNGDGTFQKPANYPAGSSPVALAVADFNGDHVPDVVVASADDNGDVVLTGTTAACQFSTSATGPATFDATGGSASLTLTTNSAGCLWTISTPSWITPSATTGIGGTTVTLQIQPNQTGVARNGSLTVGGQTTAFSQWETAQTFSDVPVSAYYFDAVNSMGSKHITTGCNVDLYCPTSDVTRAQMAIFLVRGVFGSDNFTASTTPYFLDVPAGSFGFAWIQKLFELGITTGCGGGNYCPNQTVTRAQMAIFIVRSRFGATANFDFPATPYFTDVPTGAFGFNWIQRMRLDSITTGCSATMYCPNNPVTRGDMAIFIMRGLFNQFLPAGSAAISGISPSQITVGQSISVIVTGVNTAFAQNTTAIAPIPGITIGAISVSGPQTLSVQLTARSTAVPQPVSILAVTGTQEASLPNGLVIR